jgi:hypothetical protein
MMRVPLHFTYTSLRVSEGLHFAHAKLVLTM